jgi:putative spermidine/putrescine transport system ATP-binding protein
MSVLVLEELTKSFGTTPAVAGVSLAVERGEFVCVLGPSGCGKSMVLRLIGGFERPTGGRLLIDGEPMAGVPPNRRPTGMVFQSHALWSHMTVGGNVAFGLRLRRLPRHAVREKVDQALDLVGLAGLGARHPGQLSGGQQQRVAIARCLVLEPKILLLDEPFSALDAHLRARLREELRAIQRRLGLTAVFVTHDQEEALELADRVVVMNAGKVEQCDRPGVLYDRPRTLFVAGFVGEMNLLPGEVADGRLRAEGVEAELPEPVPAGPCVVAVRPEDVAVAPADGTGAGVVERLIELGPVAVAHVRLASGQTVKARVSRAVPVREGAAVSVDIARLAVYRDGARVTEARR